MSAVRELPLRQAQPVRPPEWFRAARRARHLSWLSLLWMGAEGAVGVVTGVLAGSIALTAFGIQSFIEGLASLVIVWLFSGARLHSNKAERRAQKFVAVQFFLLVPFVGYEAIGKLVTGEQADTSRLGIALVTSSLIGMPLLGIAKRRLADKLGSVATRGEGTQNLLCAYLAGAVLAGLLGNTVLGWWWLDPIAALVIAAVSIGEGRASWRGEGCSCASYTSTGSSGSRDHSCHDPT